MFRSPSSEFVYVRTYSRWVEELGRRENWPETVQRYIDFVKKHLGDKIPPKVLRKIEEKILAFEVMPSMRFLWAAGEPAELENVTIYNCAFSAISHVDAFSEALYILMCGTGYGFSVESKHVSLLPTVPNQIASNGQVYEVEDSKAGWADSLKVLINLLYSGQDPEMRYNKIRPAGARLKTMGGRASGPGPLAQLHSFTKGVFYNARGRQLTSQECHDILCEVAQIVVVGGVRRSSEMSLSDLHDKEMRESKTGNFPVRRYMANNSAVYNSKPDIVTFMNEWAALISSGSGERGIFNLEAARTMAPKRRFSNKIEGTNPCKPLKSLILTPNGYINISQALELPSLLIVDPQGRIKEASKPFLTGHKIVKALTLSNGCKLYGTENHKHKVKDGEWTEIKDLNIGSKLEFSAKAVSSLDISNKETYEDGLVAGWIWADGWSFKRSDSETSYRTGMCFGINEFDVAPLFEELTGSRCKPHSQKPDTCKIIKCFMDPRQVYEKYNISKDKSDLAWIHKCDPNFKIGFIKSAFTADGSVRKHNGVELYSVNRETLEILSHTLLEFGIRSTVTLHGNAKSYVAKDGKIRNNKACWKLNVYAGQFKKIGFLSVFKQNLLNEQKSTKIYRYMDYVSVVEIEDVGMEDVYDITVYSDEHSYIDGGITTHNCGEIQLRSEQFCNLSEVVARAEDDMDTMLEKIETSTWMGIIQSCMTNFPYLGPNWAKNCNEERLLGVSITGQFDAPHLFHKEALKSYKSKAIKVAKKASSIMGIPMPAAITCVKPSGCRPWDSLTITDHGILTMEDLFKNHDRDEEWGDVKGGISVIQENGKSKISKTYNNGLSEVYKISLNYNLALESTPNHKWFVSKRRIPNLHKRIFSTVNEWIETKDIKTGDVIDTNTNNYNKTENERFKKFNPLSIEMRSDHDEIYQPDSLDEDLSWLFGYLWGDGAMSPSKYRIRFTDQHEFNVRKAARVVKEKFNIDCEIKRASEYSDAYILDIASKSLWHWLIKNDVWKYFKEELDIIPTIVRKSSKSCVIAFIAGLIDSDGAVFKTPEGFYKFQISTVYDRFSNHLQHICWSVGLGVGRSLQTKGTSFQKEKHLYHLTSSKYIEESSFSVLVTHSNKMRNRIDEKWQFRNDCGTKNVPILGEVVDCKLDRKERTYDIEVPDTHYYFNGIFKSHNTVSQLVDSASGLHPRFAKHYIRRYRISSTDPLFKMIRDQGLPVSPENGQRKQDYVKAVRAYDAAISTGSPIVVAMADAKSSCPIFDNEGWTQDKVNTWIVSFPMASPDNAITVEDMSALDQLDWYKKIQKNWCEHNASITVYVKPEEWLSVGDWVYKNWEIVNGISFLPVSEHVYEQAPYEKITKEEYDKMSKTFPKIDYTQLGRYEREDNTEGSKALACAGGNCDI